MRPDEVRAMSIQDAFMLYKAADVLEARELLSQMKASSFPHMTKQPRKDLFKNVRKLAEFNESESGEILSTEQLAKHFSKVMLRG